MDQTQLDPPMTENFVTRPNPTRPVDGPDPRVQLCLYGGTFTVALWTDVFLALPLTQTGVNGSKARFPLPELTARVDG